MSSQASDTSSCEDTRLWIGNLDPGITEYQLLKLVQKFGTIEKFDILFHRTGPHAGQPRGYAFVTYVNKEDANEAKMALHNKLIGSKNIVVTWAHCISGEEPEKPKSDIYIPALAMAKCEKRVNRESQIEAIEAKLKLMERKDSQELEINKTVSVEAPVVALLQSKKIEPSTSHIKNRSNIKRHDKRSAPYNKCVLKRK